MNGELSARMKVALYGLLCVLLIPFVFPTWWMLTSSLKPISDIFVFPPQLFPTHPDWSSYAQVFTVQPFAQQYWNSAWIAGVVTAATLAISSMAGYAFARIRFPGANALFIVVLTGLLIPSEVTIVPLFRMFLKLGWVNTHWPLVLIPVFGAPSVFATFVMRQFFIALPAELEEAARVDGIPTWRIYLQIIIPMMRGTFVRTHSSSVRRHAASSGNAAFLLPSTDTRPPRRWPPSISNVDIRPPSETG